MADTVFIPAGAPIVLNRFLRPRIFGTEGDEAAAIDAEEAVKRPLAYLDGAVSDGWLAGEFTVGDIAVASVIRTLGYAGWQLDEAAYPRLAAWYGRVQAREGWKQAAEVENAMIAAAGF